MGWHLERSARGYIYEQEPLSSSDMQCRDEETAWMNSKERPWRMINGLVESRSLHGERMLRQVGSGIEELARFEQQHWKRQMADLRAAGELVSIAGGLAGLPPGVSSPATDVAITLPLAETAIWPVGYTPITAGLGSPTIWQVYAAGLRTTAASAGTSAYTARLGTTVSGPVLGAVTAAITETNSETAAFWRISGFVVAPRTGGGATGANSTAVGYFEYFQTTGTAGPGGAITGTPVMFGGTTASSYDSSLAQGLWMGCTTTTSTTNTVTPRIILWGSWN